MTAKIPMAVSDPDPITIAAIAKLQFQRSVTVRRLIELADGSLDRLLMMGCIVRINEHGAWLCLDQIQTPIENRRQSGFLAAYHRTLVIAQPSAEAGEYTMIPVPPWQAFLIHGHTGGPRCGCARFDDDDIDSCIFSNTELRQWKATN